MQSIWQSIHKHYGLGMMDNGEFGQMVKVSGDYCYQFSSVDKFGNTITCKYIGLEVDYEQRVYSASLNSNS